MDQGGPKEMFIITIIYYLLLLRCSVINVHFKLYDIRVFYRMVIYLNAGGNNLKPAFMNVLDQSTNWIRQRYAELLVVIFFIYY